MVPRDAQGVRPFGIEVLWGVRDKIFSESVIDIFGATGSFAFDVAIQFELVISATEAGTPRMPAHSCC
jgi:hypothetical protein